MSDNSEAAKAAYTVLVVDDFEAMRRQIEFALSKLYGINVLCAEDGEQGLAMMRERQPSLVILDLDMPGMHGLEVLARCKEDPRIRDIPVVVLTASETVEGIIPKVLLAGATDYLRKPIDILDLKQYVSARIALAEARKADKAFRGRIHHDLNNPLTAVICFAEMLQQDDIATDPKRVKELSAEIETAGARLYEMMQQLITGRGT